MQEGEDGPQGRVPSASRGAGVVGAETAHPGDRAREHPGWEPPFRLLCVLSEGASEVVAGSERGDGARETGGGDGEDQDWPRQLMSGQQCGGPTGDPGHRVTDLSCGPVCPSHILCLEAGAPGRPQVTECPRQLQTWHHLLMKSRGSDRVTWPSQKESPRLTV